MFQQLSVSGFCVEDFTTPTDKMAHSSEHHILIEPCSKTGRQSWWGGPLLPRGNHWDTFSSHPESGLARTRKTSDITQLPAPITKKYRELGFRTISDVECVPNWTPPNKLLKV